MFEYIGITEGADPTVNLKWKPWVKSGKPAILITKAPSKLLSHLTGFENIIIHCTITGLGGSKIEPGINPPEEELVYYHTLCELFGKERVVLRIDPIIPGITTYKQLKALLENVEGRVRISFMDNYDHVKYRFSNARLSIPYSTFHAPIEQRECIWKDIDYILENLKRPSISEVCCEPGLPSVSCVSKLDCEILGVVPSTNRRDQRPYCNCPSNKKELCTKPPKCTYSCLYCYWKD